MVWPGRSSYSVASLVTVVVTVVAPLLIVAVWEGIANQPFSTATEREFVATYCVSCGGRLFRTFESAEGQGVCAVVLQRSEDVVVDASLCNVERTCLCSAASKQQREDCDDAQGAQHGLERGVLGGGFLGGGSVVVVSLDRVEKNGHRVFRYSRSR